MAERHFRIQAPTEQSISSCAIFNAKKCDQLYKLSPRHAIETRLSRESPHLVSKMMISMIKLLDK
jgi:hypothetical protein